MTMNTIKHFSWRHGVVAGLMTLTVLGSTPLPAQAQATTNTELQALINEILARIAVLQGTSVPTTPGTTLPAYTWYTSLSLGATGEAVRELQRFLNSDVDTRVALSGAGAPGSETTYYGPATAAAVSKFQAKYRSDILVPNGLAAPTGIFGPSSIAKANALRAAAPTTPTNPTNPTTPTNPGGSGGVVLRGEGELADVMIIEADDMDITEGSSDVPVAELSLEAKNGDIRVTRLDLALVADSGNGERDPWDTFESISLWLGSKKLAEKNIDARTDYQNRNDGTIRLSGLDIVVREDDWADVVIALTPQNNVRGAGTAADWSLSVDGMRYFDADGVSNDDRSTGELGQAIAFSIVPRGDREELKFSLASSNPTPTSVMVDERRRTSGVTVLEYEIEAVAGDIELDELAINLRTGTAAYSDVIDAVRIVVDGTTFRSRSITTTGDYSPTSVLALFDLGGRVTIDEDESVTVEVVVDIKPQTAYQNGETILAQVTSLERSRTQAEGEDDITVFSGTVVGETHRLVAEGITLDTERVRTTTATLGQNSTAGVFTLSVPMTAIGNDFYVVPTASTAAAVGGFTYTIDGGTGFEVASAVLSSTADETGSGVYIVREGRTETFTLTVTLDPSAAGQYRIGLAEVTYSANTDGTTSGETFPINEINRFRTGYQFINN